MLTFKNDPAVAESVRRQMQAHYDADEIIRGTYWQEGKGCFIGCLTHDNSLTNAELASDLIGWPTTLVCMAETIFEELSNSNAKDFARDLMLATPVGKDARLIPLKLVHWAGITAYSLYNHRTMTDMPHVEYVLDQLENLINDRPVTPESIQPEDIKKLYKDLCSPGRRVTPYGEIADRLVRILINPDEDVHYDAVLYILLRENPKVTKAASIKLLDFLRELA